MTVFSTSNNWLDWRQGQSLNTWRALDLNVRCFDIAVLPALFATAEEELVNCARPMYEVLVYVNSDIMLTRSFISSVYVVAEKFDQFLMVGRRRNWANPQPLAIPNLNLPKGMSWEGVYLDWILENCKMFNPATDYFVYRKGMFNYDDWPQLIIGKYYWDPWIFWHAMELSIPVIDATQTATVIHQNHPRREVNPREISLNRELAKEAEDASVDLDDVPFYLNERFKICQR